jgi:diguanylate cyclase (GGDEF)-like protein
VGANLLKSWHLPGEIYEPIRYHHREGKVPKEYRVITSVLQIADDLSSYFNGSHNAEKVRRVKRVLDTEFKIQGEAVDLLIESVATSTLEMLSAFEIAPGTLRPFSLILQEANDDLCDLYDSYELQIIELKQSKKKLEKLARELAAANRKLHEMASRDSLTGVYNYRLYQEALDRGISEADRYGRQFSLIFFDIDDFKKINDVYGHPAGDLVLADICRAIGKIIRGSDTFARCGGDEFVVVMPETNLEKARIVAEHMRWCVEELEVRMGDINIKTSISTGCSCYDPSDKTLDKQKLILVADKALYQSKKHHKNRAGQYERD